jgi:tRNA threonylcarbamoyladenosine biosynthesis protein TsaB
MKILALETSTEYCSVALWQAGVIAERCELVGQKHSELLMPMIEALLQATSHKLQAMDGIAFGKGPGSFTGVRIACGVAQGLALGANLPVVGICTLEALAEASGKDKVIAALDARMGELYLAAYEQREGTWQAVIEPCLCKPEDAPPVAGEGWFGCGSGFAVQGAMLEAAYGTQMTGVDGSAVPQAAAIAALAAARFLRGEGADAAQALPLYLRDKVALKTNERVGARRAVPVQMREMTPDDVDAVCAIEQTVQRFPWTRGNFSDVLDNGYVCRVDEAEGGIRGYAVLMPVVDEAELLTIGVAAAHQRKGLGRALLNAMLQLARERKMVRVFLEVRPSNAAAVALYRRAGFEQIGMRRDYYRDEGGSEDAITMACDLTDGGTCAGTARRAPTDAA